MQWAHWYSNCVLCYDLINGIWLLAWILEMGLDFGTLKMVEAGGKKGPWEAKNAWRAEASPCQLGCRSLIFLQHLRMSEAVITSTASHRWRGSGTNEYPVMKRSQTRMVNRAVRGFFWKANPITCLTSWLSRGPKWKTAKCIMKSLHNFLSNRARLPPRNGYYWIMSDFFFIPWILILVRFSQLTPNVIWH